MSYVNDKNNESYLDVNEDLINDLKDQSKVELKTFFKCLCMCNDGVSDSNKKVHHQSSLDKFLSKFVKKYGFQ